MSEGRLHWTACTPPALPRLTTVGISLQTPDYWEPGAAAEIIELAVERDDAAGGDIAA